MRIFATILFSFCFSLIAYAQPANDNCSGLIELGKAPVCNKSTVYSNVGATAFDTGSDNEPSCFKSLPPQNDVWFSFVADASITEYTITANAVKTNNNGIKNMQVAVYRGFCAVGALILVDCGVGSGSGETVKMNLSNLTPGETYYIRVDNSGGDEFEGEFFLCVEERAPEFKISDGSSNLCSGTLYDSGGPNGDYGPSENYTFTICPDQVNISCLALNFEYYNLEYSENATLDYMNFYNGPDASSPLIKSIGGSGESHSGGGVNFEVFADSCMTIVFISDDMTQLEGFKAEWNCSYSPCPKYKPVNITTGATNEQIEALLSTPNAKVTVDKITCDDGAYGLFTNGESTDLGIKNGIILTTGKAINAIGPNDSRNKSTIIDSPGDSDLDYLSEKYSNGTLSGDACIVEIDVKSYVKELQFEYIYGSEEYEEFVDKSYTDIFALLASGPGITGIPEINNQENLAVLPNGSFIEINTLNHLKNWEYYRNNSFGKSIQYDGLTSDSLGIKKSLTASFVTQPCSTYHLKFAVADRSDKSYDSGVFISELTSKSAAISTKFSSGLDYFVEKCAVANQDTLVINLGEPNELEQVFSVVISGTATEGEDYEFDIPNVITFAPGDTLKKFGINVLADDLVEGVEEIIITLYRDTGCDIIEVAKQVIEIKDQLEVKIEADGDTIYVCGKDKIKLNAEGGTSFIWAPFFIFDDPLSKTPIIENTEYSGYVEVTGTIEPFTFSECTDKDTVYIKRISPEVEIVPLNGPNICASDSLVLTYKANETFTDVKWKTSFNNAALTKYTGDTTSYYDPFAFLNMHDVIIEVEKSGCIATDTIEFLVDSYTKPIPLFQDTTICEGDTIQFLQIPIYNEEQNFGINPEDYLITDPIELYPNYTSPKKDIKYTMVNSSMNKFCSDTLEFDITVLPNNVEIVEGDSLRICLGDSINLTANPEPKGMLKWSADQNYNIEDPTSEVINVKPIVKTNFTVSVANGMCTAEEVVTVYVDSLPNMYIDNIPKQDPYCKGMIVTLVSPEYANNKFFNITHSWTPSTGVQNNITDYNLVISAQETTKYIRTTTSGGCVQKDTFDIRVVDPKLSISPGDTSVCKDSKFLLKGITDDNIQNWEWSASPGASFDCGECQETNITVGLENLQITLKGDEEGCPVSATTNISIIDYNGVAEIAEDPTTIPNEKCQNVYFLDDVLTITAKPYYQPPSDAIYSWSKDATTLEGVSGEVIQNIVNTKIANLKNNECVDVNVAWLVKDANGCTGEGGVNYQVAKRFIVPNAFSPKTGDEFNEVFRLVDRSKAGGPVTIKQFTIVNRYGQKMFDCNDYNCATDSGWDGNFNGKEQPGDTYMYYIVIEFQNGTKEIFKGDLLLMR